MADEVKKLVVGLGVDSTDLKAGITEVNRDLKVLRSEFKAIDSTMGPLSNSLTGLEKKNANLSKQMELQREKVMRLNSAYQQAVEKSGASSKEAQNLAVKLNNQITVMGRLEKQTDKNTESMEDLRKQNKLTIESFAAMGKTMTKVGEQIAKVGTTLTIGVSAPIIAVGKRSLDMAIDVQESESMFEQSFGNMSETARKWSEDLSDSLGLNEFALRENVAVFNDMAKAMGLTSEEALKLSTDLTERVFDIASLKNKKPEEIFEKVQAAITGEGDGLKRLGFVINETTSKQFAFEEGIASIGDTLSESEKVLARYNLIMEQTDSLAGDLARTIESPANQARILKEQFEELSVEIGQRLIPLFMKLLDVGNEVVKWFDDMTEEEKDTIVQMALLAASVGPVLLVLGKLLVMIGSISTALPILKTGLIALAANPVMLAIGAVALAIGAITIAVGAAQRKTAEMREELKAGIRETANIQRTAVEDSYNEKLSGLGKEQAAQETATANTIKLIQDEYNEKIEGAKGAESAQKESLNNQSKLLDKAHSEEIKRIQDEFGVFEEEELSKTEVIQQETAKRISELEKQEDEAKELYDKNIELIQEEFGVFEEKEESKTELAQSAADERIRIATEETNEKIDLIDEEFKESLKLLDEETRRKIQDVDDQIQGIEDLTEQEKEAKRVSEREEKIRILQSKIDNARSNADRVEATRDLNELLTEINEEKIAKERELEIEKLEELKLSIKEEAAAKKIALEESAETRKTKELSALEETIKTIETRRDTEIEAIQEERIAKEEEEKLKLEATLGRIEEEKIEVQEKADEEIRLIQEERIAKELAENGKYLAAKASLDNQLDALDGYAEDYAEKLQEELDEKIRIEEEKLKVTQDNIQEEIDAIAEKKQAELDAINEIEKAEIEAAEIVKIENPSALNPGTTADVFQDIGMGITTGEINKDTFTFDALKESLFGDGRATGDPNWRGGMVNVHEGGRGELINLPSGSQIIPHDLSMEIASSVGKAIGENAGNKDIGNITVPVYLDSKVIAKVLAPVQYQNNVNKSRGLGVAKT